VIRSYLLPRGTATAGFPAAEVLLPLPSHIIAFDHACLLAARAHHCSGLAALDACRLAPTRLALPQLF